MNTKQIGDIAELEVLTYMTKLGYQISIPFGDNERYDQIWDINGYLLKIQIKAAYSDNDETIIISGRSNTRVNGKTKHKHYTKNEIDYFATYWDGKCYLIPVEECNSSKKLRLVPPKNNQTKGINFAEDYEVEKVLAKYNK